MKKIFQNQSKQFQFNYILILTLFLLFICSNIFALSEDFTNKINSLKWIAYAPTNFNPEKNIYPPSESIEEDLRVLFNAGFNGIITYGSESTLANVPKIAKEAGFRGIIMGIWNIRDKQELNSAIKMIDYVDGYCVGNEGLSLRYELDELTKVMEYVKTTTAKPVTTTEQINDYAKDYMLKLGDWIFPNVHPYFSNIRSPLKAAQWIKKYYQIIKRNTPLNKPILFKEVGFSTRGDGICNERNQEEFFKLMESSEVKFAYFEAFDQYWKRHNPVEPYWGLFDKKRRPKKFILQKIKVKK